MSLVKISAQIDVDDQYLDNITGSPALHNSVAHFVDIQELATRTAANHGSFFTVQQSAARFFILGDDTAYYSAVLVATDGKGGRHDQLDDWLVFYCPPGIINTEDVYRTSSIVDTPEKLAEMIRK